MPFVQEAKKSPGCETRVAKGRARKAVELAAGKMTQRVAGKSVERKKSDIDRQNERADADAEMTAEEERPNRVMPKEGDEKDRKIKKVTMDVLQNEGESSFASIVAARRFTNSTSGGIQEECAVVGFAIVVASSAKTQRACENQECR